MSLIMSKGVKKWDKLNTDTVMNENEKNGRQRKLPATQTGTPKPRKPRPKPPDDTVLASEDGNEAVKSINEQLKEIYTKETSAKRKGKKAANEKSLLDSIRKGEGLQKDTEDTTLLANTYDPDSDPKRKKSNKARQQEMKRLRQQDHEDSGKINKGFDESVSEETKENRKVRKKINRSTDSIDKEIDKEMSISELASSPKRKPKEVENETDAMPPTIVKRKKKKKPVETESGADNVLSEGAETGDDLDNKHDKVSSEKVTGEQESKPHKKKKKKKTPRETEEEQVPRVVDEGRVIGLTIHRTDKLKTDFYIAHPVVRVHIVDEATGTNLKKQTKGRAVTSFYEAQNENVDFILPIMTQPFDFKTNQSTLPIWEELLVFNENFNYFIQDDPKVVLFFELLDFVSMNTASQKYNRAKEEGGWHRIAWGFFKVTGSNGKPNTDKKVRLQLYLPPIRFRPKPGQVEVYQWWKAIRRIPYPSTLYISMKGIIPPDKVEPAVRSMFATQEERGRVTYDELQKTLDGGTARRDDIHRRGPSMWTRMPGQVCKIPNTLSLCLPAGRKGCFVIRFSPDGKSLACGCHDKDGHPILIYEIPSGRLKGQLLGHYSIIYDLCWAKSGKYLLSGSADGTGRVWNVDKMSSQPVKMLPHPSFVYTAKYHNHVDRVAVTGGYDRMIRIWTLKGDDSNAQLLQELDHHQSYVNSICFDAEGAKMFSADSMGIVRMWNVYVTEKPSSKGVLKEWTLDREFSDPELQGVAISSISLHPNGRRLLLHCRDNTLRMVDLRVSSIMQRYTGSLNFREHVRSTLSPCGSFVFGGSEDACAYVWNTDSGDQVAMYTELSYSSPVSDVCYHPYDHLMALCSFGENHPILIYKHDHDIAQRNLGIETMPSETARSKGRPMSPTLKPGADLKSDDEGLETSRTNIMSLRGTASLSQSTRLERALRKMDVVATFKDTVSTIHPHAVPPHGGGLGGATLGTTWGSTFDATNGMNGFNQSLKGRPMSPLHSAFSPHASKTLTEAAIAQQQLASHTDYMRQSDGLGRGGFVEVGRSGSPTHFGRHYGSMSMSTKKGKPQFTFEGGTARTQIVVAMYVYQGQRSDELTLARGDQVKVLYKDNENWWMGEAIDGQQGFFPANYVTELTADDSPQSPKGDDCRVQIDPDEDDDGHETTTAVVSKSGELKFISST